MGGKVINFPPAAECVQKKQDKIGENRAISSSKMSNIFLETCEVFRNVFRILKFGQNLCKMSVIIKKNCANMKKWTNFIARPNAGCAFERCRTFLFYDRSNLVFYRISRQFH